jgi:hypothetical protein
MAELHTERRNYLNFAPGTPLVFSFWIAIAPWAILGPYLFSGFRAEQVFIYASALICLLWAKKLLPGLRPSPVLGLVLLAVPLVVGSIVYLTKQGLTIYLVNLPLANLDNATSTIAIVIVSWAWVARVGKTRVMQLFSASMVFSLAVAGLIAVVHQFYLSIIEPLLDQFVDPRGYSESVSILAASMGRTSGIFNQPAEAGIAFSAGLLACFALISMRFHQPILWSFCAVPIIAGGLVSASKIFLLIGFPLTVILILFMSTWRLRFTYVAVLATITIIDASILFVNGWRLNSYLINSYVNTENPLSGITAGRVGADSALTPLFKEVEKENPFVGLGIEGIPFPVDSQVSETLMISGYLGTGAIALFFLLLLTRWIKLLKISDKAQFVFIGSLLALVTASAVGIPSLSSNRSSALILVLLASYLLCGSRRPVTKELNQPTIQKIAKCKLDKIFRHPRC